MTRHLSIVRDRDKKIETRVCAGHLAIAFRVDYAPERITVGLSPDHARRLAADLMRAADRYDAMKAEREGS